MGFSTGVFTSGFAEIIGSQWKITRKLEDRLERSEHTTCLNERSERRPVVVGLQLIPLPNRNPEEAILAVKKGHKKFYLRPKYIIKKTIDLALHLPPEKILRILKAGNEMIK